MDKKTIRITGAQCSFSVGAIQENKETILNCFEEAESVGGTEPEEEGADEISAISCRDALG